jgi:phosphatidyl-myo-inositol dimannoside synthase
MTSRPLRVLFISRKFPPSVGGMQKLSYRLITGMQSLPGVDARAIVWGYSQRLLPFFIIYALLSGIGAGLRGVDMIHVGDPVLAGLGLALAALLRVPLAITVHGLDLTFPLPVYRALVPRWVARYDRVICISNAAYEVAMGQGIAPRRCRVIHPGVELPAITATRAASRAYLSQALGHDLTHARLLLTVGRLVPRKGVRFFVTQVLPRLLERHSDYVYLVIGSGPEREPIMQAGHELQLGAHLLAPGYLPADAVLHAYNASDLFVAPNVAQPGDMEGFGLVVVEAAAAGCPVLVADLEGLRDTLPPGEADRFAPSGDAQAWADKIEALLADPPRLAASAASARAYVAAERTWPAMVQRYLNEFREIVRCE